MILHYAVFVKGGGEDIAGNKRRGLETIQMF